MKTYLNLWYYLAKFFLESEVFQTKGVEIKHTFHLQFFFVSPQILLFMI